MHRFRFLGACAVSLAVGAAVACAADGGDPPRTFDAGVSDAATDAPSTSYPAIMAACERWVATVHAPYDVFPLAPDDHSNPKPEVVEQLRRTMSPDDLARIDKARARYCAKLATLPGSTITPEFIDACAVRGSDGGLTPDCGVLPAGTLPVGADCVQDFQCASRGCFFGDRKCSPEIPYGERCVDRRLPPFSGYSVPCGGGLVCLNDVCRTREEAAASRVVALPHLGESCEYDCADDLICVSSDGGPRTCQAKASLDQPCRFASDCAGDENYCACGSNPDGLCTRSGVCSKRKLLGGDCTGDPFECGGGYCACPNAESACDAGTCAPSRAVGEACIGRVGECGVDHECVPECPDGFKRSCRLAAWLARPGFPGELNEYGCVFGHSLEPCTERCPRLAGEGETCGTGIVCAPFTVCHDAGCELQSFLGP